MTKTGQAYKDAGVDIDKAAELVERIKPHISKTKRSGVMAGIGGFGALFDLKETGYNDPVLVSATDGVGTKLKIAIDSGIHNTIGIDCVAMCVNDLVVQGAEPFFFLDYFATGSLDNDTAEDVISSVARGCEIAGCALIGGETAEMPGMYKEGDYDLAGFTVGAVERDKIITGDNIEEGDVLLGLASDGIHSNGYSLVRRLIEGTQGYELNGYFDFEKNKTIAEILLTPTRIYVKPILNVLNEHEGTIKGMAHITGGGFLENIPRILPENLGAEIDCSAWSLPPLFRWLKDAGQLSHDDLASTLNCGIGMVVICKDNDKDILLKAFEEQGETAYIIGQVTKNADKPLSLLHADKHW